MAPILLCGIPASGKSTYGSWLKYSRGMGFVDVEEAGQLESVGLENAWADLFVDEGAASRLVDGLRQRERPFVFAWGFPLEYLPIVSMLKKAGFQVWWFDGDRDAARAAFAQRGEIPIECFDIQMAEIEREWTALSELLADRIVRSVHAGPTYARPEEIDEILFSGGGGERRDG